MTSTVTIDRNDSLLFERKLENVTDGLAGECRNIIIKQIRSDAFVLMDYMLALRTEINPSDNYRKSVIKNVGKFIKFCRLSTDKPLKELERDDVLAYLDSLRKSESSDSLHKWIGTYNLHRVHLLRFFKWLHSPNIEQHKRPKPSVVDNIPQLRRKEKSIYKPSDMWTPEDDLLFLKYCPSKRMKCYHSMANMSLNFTASPSLL